MVSHDCVAFYLLSEEVSHSVKVVQSGQGADEVLAGYDWYPPLAGGRPGRRGRGVRAGVLRPALVGDEQAARPGVAARPRRADRVRRRAASAGPGAETAVDAALRIDTTVMLVDDPVKRVDNMTMAWGLEARVPFLDHELVELAGRIPPELKLADGGKGVLKRASRGVVPDEVIDRTKGYFPVPAIRQLEGPYLERVRDALTDPAAQRRGLFRRQGRTPDAGRPEHDPHHPGLERAVAARAAGDVAAAPRCWLSEPDRRSRTARRGSWSAPGAAGARPSPPTAPRWRSSATGAGHPQVWVQDCRLGRRPAEPTDDHARPATRWSRCSWSADGGWLACALATDGGVRTQVWVVRPDGRDARLIAGGADSSTPSSGRGPAAGTGSWSPSRARSWASRPCAYLVDPATGDLTPLAAGELISVLDLSVDEDS